MPARRRTLRRKAALALCAVLVLGASLEGGSSLLLRGLLDSDHRDIAMAHLTLVAGAHLPGTRNGPNAVNRMGFYGPEFSPRKPPGTFRILVVGASAVADWPQQVERLLAPEVQVPLEVINGGIPGSISISQAVSVDRWIALDPDLVVVYTGFNDVYYAHYLPEIYACRESKTYRRWLTPLGRFQRWLTRHSRTACLIRCLRKGHRLPDLGGGVPAQASWACEPNNGCRGAPPFVSAPTRSVENPRVVNLNWGEGWTSYELPAIPDLTDRSSDSLRRNVGLIADTLRPRGVPGIVLLQPNLAYSAARRGPTDEEQAILGEGTGAMYEDWLAASRVLYPAAIRAMREACDQGGLRFVDFAEGLDGITPCPFSDAVHQTPTGRAAIAARVADLLRDSGLLPPSRHD